MNEFNFQIKYKKGSEMPADFLSRNVVKELNIASIDVFGMNLAELQEKDEFFGPFRKYLTFGQLPNDRQLLAKIHKLASEVFFENNILWRRIVRDDLPRTVLCVPHSLAGDLVQEAHGQLLTGHNGVAKTKERLLQSYYWPNMDAFIYKHITSCQKCQVRRTDHRQPPNILTPLPLTTDVNQRIHMDLFGPLKTSGSGKSYVLCITDSFSKYIELVAVPNKEAATVVGAVMDKWICRYGIPLEIVSDNGKEFCNEFSKLLFEKLQIKHSTSTPYHPQTNASAEVCNKYIAKYLTDVVDASTLDWELHLPALMFSYNTSLHETIKMTPFELTFGVPARTTDNLANEIKLNYGENDAGERLNRLLFAKQIAHHHALKQSHLAEKNHNRHARPHQYKVGQWVLLENIQFLGKNKNSVLDLLDLSNCASQC